MSDLWVIGEIQHVGNRSIIARFFLLSATTTSTEVWKQRDHDRDNNKNPGLWRETESRQEVTYCSPSSRWFWERKFKLIYDENQWKSKKPRTEKERVDSSNISFQHSTSLYDSVEPDAEAIAQMKDIIYSTAPFRPVNHSTFRDNGPDALYKDPIIYVWFF